MAKIVVGISFVLTHMVVFNSIILNSRASELFGCCPCHANQQKELRCSNKPTVVLLFFPLCILLDTPTFEHECTTEQKALGVNYCLQQVAEMKSKTL